MSARLKSVYPIAKLTRTTKQPRWLQNGNRLGTRVKIDQLKIDGHSVAPRRTGTTLRLEGHRQIAGKIKRGSPSNIILVQWHERKRGRTNKPGFRSRAVLTVRPQSFEVRGG